MTPMRERILEIPQQLRWAIDADVAPSPPAEEVIIAGMGGSAMAGDVAALVAAAGGRRVTIHRTYGLPEWAARVKPLVLAISYSGTTEETLSAVEAASKLGLAVAVISTGGELVHLAGDRGWPLTLVPPGLQPRAAIGFQTGAAMRALESAGIISDSARALEEAAVTADDLLESGSGVAFTLGADIGDALTGKTPVIYAGHGVGSVAARRWKAQINENAKGLAIASEIPELDHNELEGWAGPGDHSDHAVVVLRDDADHPRITMRLDLTASVMANRVPVVGEVRSRPGSVLARVFSLILPGDIASVVLAENSGVDVTAVDVLEDFKKRLREVT